VERARARYLTSPAGRKALAERGARLSGLGPVELATALRRELPAFEASAIAEQVTLRGRARARFGPTFGYLLTADGLEMMTHPVVAARRAERLAALGHRIADLTCGIGGDLGALANAADTAVLGLERDGATALLAAANVAAARVVQGDAARPPVDITACAILLDPSRRGARGRTFDPEAFLPSWDQCLALLRSARAGVLKAPPGIDHRHVPAEAELEFVQLGRSLREAAIWMGASATPGLRRAVLVGRAELTSDEPEGGPGVRPFGHYLVDPQSCVTRAGLVRHLAHALGAGLIDPQVAYLAADELPAHPLAEAFRVIDVMPFSLSRLKARLRELGLRADEIRRRAFPVEPDELRKLLGRTEGEPVTLLCTTVAGKRMVVLARPVAGLRGGDKERSEIA
jgi:THUMP domain-like